MDVGFLFLPRFHAEVEARMLGLQEEPIIVYKRGRVVSVSSAAEEAGLKVDMRLPQAQTICPGAELLPLVEDRCQPFQKEVLDICTAHVASVEPVEPGEVFIDLADLKQPEEALACLRKAVRESTGFTCWAGCGPSKLVAKIAGQMPSGRTVSPEEVADFLAPLPISQLWNLDKKTLKHLQALGISTIGLLRRISRTRLAEHFGSDARRLHELARGIDNSPVKSLYPPRTVTAQQTLPGGVDNPEVINTWLGKLAGKVAKELQLRQEACGRVSMRVTMEEGQRASNSLKLCNPTSEGGDILRACRVLLSRLEIPAPVSAIAIKASECRRDSGTQLSLFYDNQASSRKQERASKALEVVRQCFGNDIAVLGTEIELPRRERFLAALSTG